tara:strand:- start:778 stop:1701 length:924 start_codon:yes stop_codon:yes gene_type:complete
MCSDKKLKSLIINKTLLLILLSFLIGNCSTNRDKQLNSSEYKLLLSPDKFDNPLIGFKNYWEIVKKVAKNHNISVVEKTKPFTLKHKEVSFFDTEKRELRKAGFLIRQKVKYENGNKKPGFEYGVKYRQTEPENALAVDLILNNGYTPKDETIELESDIVYFSRNNGSAETTYSVSNSTLLDEAPEMRLGSFADIYPALGKLGIPETAPLTKVAGVSADEWMVVPGKLDFGDGLFGRVDMTVWIIPTRDGELRIPEFSFDHPFVDGKQYDKDAMSRCTEFIVKLQEFEPSWVVPGALKAAFLFELEQ